MRAEKFVYCLLMIVLFAGIPTGKAGRKSKVKQHRQEKISSRFWISLLPVQHSSTLALSSR